MRLAVQGISRSRLHIGRTLYASRASTHFLWRVHHPSVRFFSSSPISSANNSHRRWPWGLFFLVVVALGYSLTTAQSIEADEVSDEEKIKAYLAEAEKYLAAGDVENAVNCFDQILKIESDDNELCFKMAKLCYKHGFFDLALELYGIAVEIDPEDASAYYLRGSLFHELERIEEALADYTKSIELNDVDYNQDLYLRRGFVFESLGKLEEAVADFSQVLLLNPENADIWYLRSVLFMSLEYFEKALFDIDQAIAINPKKALHWSMKGLMLKKLGRNKEALDSYAKVIELEPEKKEAYIEHGALCMEFGQLKEALSDFTKAIQLDPQNSNNYYNRGIVHRQLEKFDEALADYTKAIELDPSNVHAYHNRGVLFQNLNQLEKALADYDSVLNLDSKYFNSWNNRGNVLRDLGRIQEALISYEKAIECHAESSMLYYNRGKLFFRTNQLEEALADFNHAIEIDSKYLDAYVERAELFSRCGQTENALADYHQAMIISSEVPCSHHTRGLIFQNLSQLEKALIEYDHAIALEPTDGSTWNNRGNVLRDLNRVEEALASYEKALEHSSHKALIYVNRANLFSRQDKLEEALQDCNKAIALDQNYALAYNTRAVIFLEMNQVEHALVDLDFAIKLNPHFLFAYRNRATVLKKLVFNSLQFSIVERDVLLTDTEIVYLEKALADYTKVIEFGYEDADIYFSRALIFRKLGCLTDALADSTKARDLDPQNADIYSQLGTIFRDLDRLEEALSAYDQSIALDPDGHTYGDVYYNNRGNLYHGIGKLENALADYTKAIECVPNDPTAYFNRGNVLKDLGALEEALADFDKAIALNPSYPDVHASRGRLLILFGKEQEALNEFNKEISLNNQKKSFAYNGRGVLFFLLGQYDKAMEDFSTAMELSYVQQDETSNYIATKNYTTILLAIGAFDVADKIFEEVPELRADLSEFTTWAKHLSKEYSEARDQNLQRRTALHDAALQGDTREIQGNVKFINAHDLDGKTPLILGIEKNRDDFVESLFTEDYEADISVPMLNVKKPTAEATKMWGSVDLKNMPIYIACAQQKNQRICEFLLRRRQRKDIQEVESSIDSLLTPLKPGENFDTKIITKFSYLIGSPDDLVSYYNDGLLERYRMSLHGKIKGDLVRVDYDENTRSKQEDHESMGKIQSSNENLFLKIHLFFLFESIVMMKKGSIDKEYMPLLKKEENLLKICNFFQNEFLLCLEMYHAFQDNALIDLVRSDLNFQSLNQAHADNILSKVNRLNKGEIYSYPTGYPGHSGYFGYSGHTLYANFYKDGETQETVRVRIDNLGAGSSRHVDEFGKYDQRDRDGFCRIQPCLLMIGQDGNSLSTYISDIAMARFDRNSYPETNLKKIYPATLTCGSDDLWPLQHQQLVENCVAANYMVGLYIRLAELESQLSHDEHPADAGQLLQWMKGHLSGKASQYQSRSPKLEQMSSVDEKVIVEKSNPVAISMWL